MGKMFFGFCIGMGVMAVIASARPTATQRAVRNGVNTASSVANAAVPMVASAATSVIKQGQKAADEQLSHQ